MLYGHHELHSHLKPFGTRMSNENRNAEATDKNGVDAITQVPLFISYRWNETKEDVRRMAAYLKSLKRFRVWIDTEEMYGDKNERMEEGIRGARIVLVFFNDDYQSSRDCRKEAESADRNGKDIVFVKMQRPRCKFATWFAPIISSSIFVDYYKFPNPAEEIVKHIDRILAGECQKDTHGSLSARFITVKVPKFSKYLERPHDEDKVLEAIEALSQNTTFQGALVICGGGGIGKTTLLGQVISTHTDRLRSTCGINAVVWLNCFKWTSDWDESEFSKGLIDLAQKAGGFSGCLELSDIGRQFEQQEEGLLIVLDDVFNVAILEFVHTALTGSGSVSLVVVTRDVDEMTRTHGLVADVYRINELEDEAICEMLATTYRLDGKLSQQQINDCASLCNGLPIIGSLVAARFRDCQTNRDFSAEFEVLMQDVNIKDIRIAGPYGTVSKLFAFSLEQQDDGFRRIYFAFLLFDPAHPVDVEDLMVLWNYSNPHRAVVQCRRFAKKSLARPVVTPTTDLYLVHQLLHEAAMDSALKTHNLARNVAELRTKIASRFGDKNALLYSLVQATIQLKQSLLETMLERVDLASLVEVGGRSSPETHGKPYFLFLYDFDQWPDNDLPQFFGVNQSYRILIKMFYRINKSKDICRKDCIEAITKADSDGNSVLWKLFGELNVNRYGMDRGKLRDSLKPLSAFMEFFKLYWLKECSKPEKNSSELFLSVARGESVDSMENVVKTNPNLLRSRNADGEIPLMAAARMGHFELVKWLYESAPETVDATNNEGRNSLILAAFSGDLDAVRFLYERTSNPSQSIDNKSKGPIHAASSNGNYDVARFLIEKDPECIHAVDNQRRTGFLLCCRSGYKDVVEMMVATAGDGWKDVVGDDNLMTGLHFAASNGHLDLVRFLVDKCPESLTKGDKKGLTPLMMAARKGHLEIVEFLHRCDEGLIDTLQQDGRNALAIAAERNQLHVVQWLYQTKPESSLVADNTSSVAVMWAARFGHRDVVRFLTEAMIRDGLVTLKGLLTEMKYKGGQGDTCLTVAIRFGHIEVVEFLISTLVVQVQDGQTDIDSARKILETAVRMKKKPAIGSILQKGLEAVNTS